MPNLEKLGLKGDLSALRVISLNADFWRVDMRWRYYHRSQRKTFRSWKKTKKKNEENAPYKKIHCHFFNMNDEFALDSN